MRIVFNNSVIVFAKSVWSATGKLIKVSPTEATSVNLPSGAKVYGRNLVDAEQLRYKKILNDSGVEVSDNSSYFSNFIPVVRDFTLKSNVMISRVYLYDANKTLLTRKIYGAVTSADVPSIYNGTQVAWCKIQTGGGTEDEISKAMIVMDEAAEPTTFEAFKSNASGEIYSPYSWVWADDLSEIEIVAK